MNALRKHRTPLAALAGAALLAFAAAGGAHGQAPALTRATPAAKAPDPNSSESSPRPLWRINVR
jgi:hypothetical protein